MGLLVEQSKGEMCQRDRAEGSYVGRRMIHCVRQTKALTGSLSVRGTSWPRWVIKDVVYNSLYKNRSYRCCPGVWLKQNRWICKSASCTRTICQCSLSVFAADIIALTLLSSVLFYFAILILKNSYFNQFLLLVLNHCAAAVHLSAVSISSALRGFT